MPEGRRFASHFYRTLKVTMDKTEKQALDYIKDHGASLLEEVQYRTPVKTGTLRDAWKSNINAPAPDIGKRLESRAEFMSKMTPLKIGDSIHITNNLPYARRIEYGWGVKNPPTGFARPSLKSYVRRVKER